MIGTAPQTALRVGFLCLVLVIVQIAAVSQLTVLDVPPDMAPLIAMAVGLLCGSVPGAVAGFYLGLLIDMALLQTLGVSSLLLLTVGYLAGRLRELRDPAHGLTPLAVGAATTAIYVAGFSMLHFLLGVDGPVSIEMLRQFVLTVALNSVIALPMFALVRRVLLPVLPDDPRRRRRRAYTTGGLSPISRA